MPGRSRSDVPGRSHPDGGDSLADDFWAATRTLRRRQRGVLAPWDIAPSHARALQVLTTEDAVRLVDLADRLHIAARSATEVVDALERRGYAQRQRDARDRRATLVSLTPDGRHAAEQIRAAQSATADAFFSTLSATDRSALRRILRALTQPQPD